MNIEELDPNDIQSKLSEAIAQVAAQQSVTQQKMVAKDHELFTKFTDKQSTSSPISKAKKAVDIKMADDKLQSDSSAPDIGAKVSATSASNSKLAMKSRSSPHTSARAPANSFQFQRDWKVIKTRVDDTYNYLKVRFNE